MIKRTMLFVIAAMMAAPQAKAADHIIYQLGWLPSGASGAVYVGLNDGIFEKAGLNVEVRTGRGSADTLTKVATGVADVGEVSLSTLLVAKSQGPIEAMAVLPLYTRPPDILLTVEGGPIAKLTDAVGRKIATSPYSSSNIMWPLVLKANGIDPAKIPLEQADAATLVGLLASGRVDGLITWSTSTGDAVLALKAQGKSATSLDWSAYGYQGYSQTLVASSNMLGTKTEILRRFLKAYREAEIRMKSDPSGAARSFVARVPEGNAASVELDILATLPLIFNDITDRDGLGKFSPDLVRTTWKWVSDAQGIAPAQIDPLSVVDWSLEKK